MKITALSLGIVLQASLSLAASFPTSISREPLNVRHASDRVTVGVNYEEIERGIEFNDVDHVLKAESLSLYLGYDILPWVTVFGSIGGVELDSVDGVESDSKLKVSVGVSAYVWEADILTPVYMAGRLSLKPTAELSHYESDTIEGDVDWIEAMVALPFGYERFDGYPASPKGIATSLALYVGPAISYIDGTLDTSLGDKGFEHDDLLGVIAGLDIFLSAGVSLGVEFSVFDETAGTVSLRFHL
jgi:opacity protein-like surface antigen